MEKGAVLVTGGAGYVGSHTCKALEKAGYQPIVIDDLSSGQQRPSGLRGVFIRAALSSNAIDQAMVEHNPIGVIHLAGLISPKDSIRQPERYYETNVVGTLALLHAMRNHSLNKLVFASTYDVYGEPELDQRLTESLPLAPDTPYGRSKLMVEYLLRDFSNAYGLHSISLRFGYAAGADPEGELGDYRGSEAGWVEQIVAAACNGGEFRIPGVDHFTDDGTLVRDYVHVTDVAAAHVSALQHLIDGAVGAHVYNLSAGDGYSMRQIVDAVERIGGSRVNVTEAAGGGAAPVLVGDSRRAANRLGWQPRHSSLESIVTSAWHWANRPH